MKKINLKNTIIAFLLLGMLGGCGQSPVRNPFKGRVEPKLGALPEMSEEKVAMSKILWSNGDLSKQERFSKLRPYITPEHIFAADHAGKLVALYHDSGKTSWKVNTKKKFCSGPYLIEGRLLLTTSDAKVVAFDAHSGKMLWEKKVSSEVLAPLAGSQGIILAHATDASVTALALTSGEILWHVEHSAPALTLRFCSAPAVVQDKVLVGFSTGKMLAFDLHTGGIQWERAISIPRGRSEIQRMVDISADPIVIGDSVYAITYQGKLAGIHITTGDLLWEHDLSSYQNMAHNDDLLFVTDNDHCLWAIDRFSGTTRWKQAALSERYITGPQVLGDYVVVGDRGGMVHYLSASEGHLLGRMHVSGKIYQEPLNMGEKLLVSTNKGKLLALQ